MHGNVEELMFIDFRHDILNMPARFTFAFKAYSRHFIHACLPPKNHHFNIIREDSIGASLSPS